MTVQKLYKKNGLKLAHHLQAFSLPPTSDKASKTVMTKINTEPTTAPIVVFLVLLLSFPAALIDNGNNQGHEPKMQ